MSLGPPNTVSSQGPNFECRFNWQRKYDFFDISQFFPPQITLHTFKNDSKQSSMFESMKSSQLQELQGELELKNKKLQFEKDVKHFEQENSTHTELLQRDKIKEIKSQVRKPKQNSRRHNFTPNLIGKLQFIVKRPNFLGLKKGGKLQNLKNSSKIYWYFFHEQIKKNKNLKILKQFMEEGPQFKLLDKFKQFMKKQNAEQEDLNLQKINALRRQLRYKIIQSDLLDLMKNGQMKQKQSFISEAEQIIEDLKQGKVKLQHN